MNFHGWKLSTFCFILIRAYKSLCALCCTEARSQSYLTFVCNSFYLINAKSLSLFLPIPPAATSLSRLSLRTFSLPPPGLSSSFSTERSVLRGLGAWGRGGDAGAFRPIPGFAGTGRWCHYSGFAGFYPTDSFSLRFTIQYSTEFCGTKAQWPALLPPRG